SNDERGARSIRREHSNSKGPVCNTPNPAFIGNSAGVCSYTRGPAAEVRRWVFNPEAAVLSAPGSGGFAQLRLAPPDPRVCELDDLQHVHRVDRRRERDDADRARADRRPQVPVPVPVERDEARGERGAGEREAPAPDVDGGAPLREAAP